MRRIFGNARVATLAPSDRPYGLIEGAAVVIEDGRIAAVLPQGELSAGDRAAAEDLDGRLVTPGLIDCHTHLVWGGDRAREFELRLEGASYGEIARAGGGILSTVAATRDADEEALLTAALGRLDALLADGVTTVEIKSGYGLDLAGEAKMLRVARRLAAERPVTVVATFLGAHAVPPEFEGRADAYVDHLTADMLPALAAAGLVDAVDGFCETIAFTPEQIDRVFAAATRLGLPLRLHAEQLSDQGGAALAARHGALSADHLEWLSEDGVAAMAAAGTVAGLLPGAFYFLRETRLPPVEAMRRAGVPMAVATDLNPGSSPLHSLLLAMNMACTLFRLTPEEALAGATVSAARALGLAGDRGTVEAGRRADLAIWDLTQPAQLAYAIGHRPLHRRIVAGADG